MAVSYSVALVGFAQQESSTFESFFRLAARRPPAYVVQDEVMDAQLLVVNADNMQAVHLVRYAELPGKVLLVGNTDAGTGWPLQRKPIKLVSVLAALDGLVGVAKPAPAPSHPPPVAPRRGADRSFAATQPFDSRQATLSPAARAPAPVGPGAKENFAATQPFDSRQAPLAPVARPPVSKMSASRRGADTEFPPTRPMADEEEAPPAEASGAPVARPASRPPQGEIERARQLARPGVMGVTDFGGLDALPVAPSVKRERTSTRAPRSRIGQTKAAVPEVKHGELLLVAESLVEGRILHKRFQRYDLAIDWSRDAKQAVAMLKAHVYRAVVIDRLTGEPDANQICRTAKQGKLPNGQAPVVIMFAPTAGSMDRIKASLAGCDAYLSRSVSEAELYKVLAKHRLVNLDGFEATNMGF